MSASKDLSNCKFNQLLVIRRSNNKRGTSYLWECLCDCGNITYATSADLKTGHKKSCGCLHTQQIRELGYTKKKDLTNKRFGSLVVLYDSGERKDQKVVWKCRCDCGNYCYCKSTELLSGDKTHCGCLIISSKGEKKISDLLESASIVFEREKTFKSLIGFKNRALRFDFYIPRDNYLIEFDGRQHFIRSNTGYGQDLENIQKRDQIKNNWAKENNIPLIRIPYTILNNIKLQDLIPSTSNFLIQR